MRAYFRIIAYGKPYYWMAAVALSLLLLFSLLNAASLMAVIPFLEILFDTATVPQPEQPLSEVGLTNLGLAKDWGYFYLSRGIREQGAQTMLLYFCIGLVGVMLLKNLTKYFSAYFMSAMEQGTMMRLRSHLFRHLSQQGMGFFTRRKKGDLINLLVGDVQVVQDGIQGSLQPLLREPITLLVFLTFLLLLSWKLTLFTLILLPITGLVISRIRGPLKRSARQGQETLGRLTSLIDEFISGIRIVKAFQKEAYEAGRYQVQNEAYAHLQVKLRRRQELASPITEIASIAVICLIIYYASLLILSEGSNLRRSEFLGFIALFSQVLSPLKVLSNVLARMQKAQAAFERLEALMAVQSEIQEVPQPERLPGFARELRFEGVWFRYEVQDVLKDISFRLPQGQTLALVGPSGAGKSTLADLVPRFYDPYRGRILIDGHDLKQLSLRDLRGQIGIVSQEAILFHDTIVANIAYGEPKPDRAAVEEAARMAYAHEFIMQLPQGYDTVIGERGTMLSGGQRQRISIARAIFRSPAILILDEATSNLDTQSEKLVQEALERLMRHRTSLVIAHRLSTIRKADLILVLDQGRVIEQGTHASLLTDAGLYRELYENLVKGEATR